MSTDTLILIAAAGVALAVALWAGVAVWRKAPARRSEHLRRRFGAEYDLLVERQGAAEAERILEQRLRRVSKLPLRELSSTQRSEFSRAFRRTQELFVDTPAQAVGEAHALVQEVMGARGYPLESFEQQIADLSVAHGNVVQHYRAAHELDQSNQSGRANTEELRQAMVHYRALFAELLGERRPEPTEPRESAALTSG